MLKTSSPTGSSTILQFIDVADEDEIGEGKSSKNRTHLSNPSASKKSTGVGYLTFGSAKKGGGNTKKSVKATKSSDYLIPAAKNALNYLRHTFTQAPILQHFNSEWHIWIETNISGYTISKILSQLILDNLSQWYPVAYYL